MGTLKQHYLLCIIFLFMFSLLPKIGFTLGFGPIKLYSYLNEPLDAEIELQGAEAIDPSRLIVSLASVEDFNRIELARPYFLTKLHFQVVQKNQQAFLKVTTEDPVKQPYLEFLVLMTWSEGRVVKDYTLLLDPAPFGGISKRAANEQALHMLNKTEPFEDSEAVHALQENLSIDENRIPPTAVAEAKTTAGVSDVPSNIIQDKKTKSTQTIESKPLRSKISRNQIFLASGLALLLAIALTAWFLRRARFGVRLPSANNINIIEDIVIYDEEIKLKLDLANQYIALNDNQNAESILEEIIARGNSEEIKSAKNLLKKINRA